MLMTHIMQPSTTPHTCQVMWSKQHRTRTHAETHSCTHTMMMSTWKTFVPYTNTPHPPKTPISSFYHPYPRVTPHTPFYQLSPRPFRIVLPLHHHMTPLTGCICHLSQRRHNMYPFFLTFSSHHHCIHHISLRLCTPTTWAHLLPPFEHID